MACSSNCNSAEPSSSLCSLSATEAPPFLRASRSFNREDMFSALACNSKGQMVFVCH